MLQPANSVYNPVSRCQLAIMVLCCHSLQITTHTSDVEGAATSAHVLMALSGTAGSSGTLELSHPSARPASSNGFARGEAASFTFSCAGLGDLQQLVVWHDSSGAQPAWHLAYVEVAELSSGKVNRQEMLPFALVARGSGSCWFDC
jgi:hypothetical protein